MVDLQSLSLVTITSLSMWSGTVYELHFICYNIFVCLICCVHNSFTTVYLTTCMYAMRKFALCECYCLISLTLCRCFVALLMRVCFSVCCLFLFAEGRWCFLCEYVCICNLFLFADVLWSFYVNMFVSVIYFSLQMCCGPFMGVCL